MTGANWMREFVVSHPSYKHDSKVCEQICYDLMVSVNKISENNSPNFPAHNSTKSSHFFLLEDDL